MPTEQTRRAHRLIAAQRLRLDQLRQQARTRAANMTPGELAFVLSQLSLAERQLTEVETALLEVELDV